MRNSCIGSIVALLVVPVIFSIGFAWPAQRSGAAKAKAAAPADPHDLSGVWHQPMGRRDPTMSNERPPLTPWGQAKFDATKPGYGPRAIPPALGNDPLGNCDPPGMPRLIFLEDFPNDVEIVQIPGRVMQFFERGHFWREIWTDGRELPKDPEPRWLGYSVGKWDGDTFVVDSLGFDERSWLDRMGNVHSDEMRFQERYRRVNPDTLELSMTINDPKTYTKPWVSITKTLGLAPKPEGLDEIFCVPSEEQLFNRTIRDPAGGVIHK
jgi:hypothetical protein